MVLVSPGKEIRNNRKFKKWRHSQEMRMAAFPLQHMASQPPGSLKTCKDKVVSPTWQAFQFMRNKIHSSVLVISCLLKEGEYADIKEHLAPSSIQHLIRILFSCSEITERSSITASVFWGRVSISTYFLWES